MASDVVVIAPTRDTVVWITPTELRRIADHLEKTVQRSKGRFAMHTIGKKDTGQVIFQYKEL